MQFTSLAFAIFLVVVFAAYWLARSPQKQNLIVVLASYLFYGWWDYRFCFLILFSSLVDYAIGRRLATTASTPGRRILLVLSLVSNLGLLAVFKYFGFFMENFVAVANSLGWQPGELTIEIILPVGISFYTFQTLSYTIDVYRKKLEPSHNLVDYLAFVSFFPQLVAGPIERGTNLLPQFQKARTFDYENAVSGCRLILWGLVKKIAVADLLAVTVNSTYSHWESMTGTQLLLATVFFAFQIYCDFSAYSDIAIGTARLFSIRLMRNFAYPYFSQSITEFWSRWHISLSTWFRDYVYIPLGGNRVSSARQKVNIFLTFLISGFWHGAAWTFVGWGALHGAALNGEKMVGKNGNPRAPLDFAGRTPLFVSPWVALKMLLTFSFVCCGWVFFRAESLSGAVGILGKIFREAWLPENLQAIANQLDADKVLMTSLIVLIAFCLFEWVQRKHACPLVGGSKWLVPLRWGAYSTLILVSLELASNAESQSFIYFAF